jgi:hypothetical protein
MVGFLLEVEWFANGKRAFSLVSRMLMEMPPHSKRKGQDFCGFAAFEVRRLGRKTTLRERL